MRGRKRSPLLWARQRIDRCSSYRTIGAGTHKLSPGPATRERQVTRFTWRRSPSAHDGSRARAIRPRANQDSRCPNEFRRREMRRGTYCVIRNNRQVSGQRDFRDAMIVSTQASGDRPSHRDRHPGTTGERPLPRRSRHRVCSGFALPLSCRATTAYPPQRSHRRGRAIAFPPVRTLRRAANVRTRALAARLLRVWETSRAQPGAARW